MISLEGNIVKQRQSLNHCAYMAVLLCKIHHSLIYTNSIWFIWSYNSTSHCALLGDQRLILNLHLSDQCLSLEISGDQNMVWDSLIIYYYFFPLFERASRTFCQHLTCHIWRYNENVVIAQSFRELLNFC